jgi:Nucleotidyl transferase AbiEii toxin, Type IV TA system
VRHPQPVAERDLAEAFVEKDYWITEILRVVAATLVDRAIFKGGTSLSKGWGLLDRFSENLDLFIDPPVEPPFSTRGIDRALKKRGSDVEAIDGLELLESNTIGGFGRMDTFGYRSAFPTVAGLPPTVRLESGVQSGKAPTQDVEISSLVAEVLHQREAATNLPGVQGRDSFTMSLLHYRRTLSRRSSPSTAKVERLKTDGRAAASVNPGHQSGAPQSEPGSRGWASAVFTCSSAGLHTVLDSDSDGGAQRREGG